MSHFNFEPAKGWAAFKIGQQSGRAGATVLRPVLPCENGPIIAPTVEKMRRRFLKQGPNSMQLRAARPDETPRLDEISLQAKASWGYSPSQLETWAASLATSAELVETQPTVVAEEHGKAIGFAQIVIDEDYCELISLWVLPNNAGRGVGRALLQSMVQAARERGQEVIAIDSDPNAEQFYVRCGAVRVGSVPAPIPGEPERTRPQLRLATNPG